VDKAGQVGRPQAGIAWPHIPINSDSEYGPTDDRFGSKRELAVFDRMSASTSCGHNDANAYAALPKAAVNNRSKEQRVLDPPAVTSILVPTTLRFSAGTYGYGPVEAENRREALTHVVGRGQNVLRPSCDFR
jgi:hypothetical protein